MKLTPGWSYEVDDDVAGGLAHGAGLARGDGVEPFHWLHFLCWRARLGGFLHIVDFLGSSPLEFSPSTASFDGGSLRTVLAAVIGRVTGPTDGRFGTVGCIMVCWTITRGAVTVPFDPLNLLGGL